MITWMQKNKKYLVVTIWISVIAFVGAGFVGWGAYDLNNNRATSVATVGHRNISVQELQQKYNQIYNYYSNIFDGQFTQEKAEEIGLENIAMQAVIQDNLLLNFADDIGLSVSDENVLKYIVADPSFQTDGAFNKNLYYDVLRRARINPNDYEKNLKRQILMDKINFILKTTATQKDIELMNAAFFMQDRVAVEIIKSDKNEITVNENELKQLWENNKNNYMTDTLYGLQTLYIESNDIDVNATELTAYYNDNKDKYKDSDDKIIAFENAKEQVLKDYSLEKNKTQALEKYIAVKKGEISTDSEIYVTENNATFDMQEIKEANLGETIKPFIYQNGYLITKIKSITPPQPMSFEAAREQVLEIYKFDKSKEILESKTKAALANFKGKDIGFISRDLNQTIDGLEIHEAQAFVSQLLESPNKKGYIVLDDKAVIYEILEQKLLTNDINNNYKQLVEQNIANLKNSELMQDLTNELQKRYVVKEYIKR
ncbi:peptidylprolyl isomerase [Campylobacter sp. RM9328]|uniref:peptidylprolyl isomerase n=1 Tax=Campylobacter sp. RM9328 TaxID=1705720 RepID=UPI00147345B3|nr:peptidylprolyl isomerase [Campylobacter sp. RM9328]